jgi:beta-phosphoglucomutase-like phosphatase (HAD superfamily)
MALVSASTRKIMDAALFSIGREFFLFTCSADDVKKTKPDPEGYIEAAKRLDVRIENSLIVEDSKTGMSAAIASGAYVLGLPHLTELPVGEKVIHRQDLVGLDLYGLASLFKGVLV